MSDTKTVNKINSILERYFTAIRSRCLVADQNEADFIIKNYEFVGKTEYDDKDIIAVDFQIKCFYNPKENNKYQNDYRIYCLLYDENGEYLYHELITTTEFMQIISENKSILVPGMLPCITN